MIAITTSNFDERETLRRTCSASLPRQGKSARFERARLMTHGVRCYVGHSMFLSMKGKAVRQVGWMGRT